MEIGVSIRGRVRQVLLRAWLVLLPVAVLVVAGCGDGDGHAPSSATAGARTAALTKAELLEQGNAICAKAYAAMAEFNPQGTPKEAVRVADLTGDMLKRLLGLGVPQETEGFYSEYTVSAHRLVQAEAAVKSVAARNDPAALKNTESIAYSYLNTFQNWASEYGLKECDLEAYLTTKAPSQVP